jgi:uncharacterized protein YyaL (SSP411 family)
LGYFIAQTGKFPDVWTEDALESFEQTFDIVREMKSPRSMAFAIKGLFYFQQTYPSSETFELITLLADKLVNCYQANREDGWKWFEAYLTYDNSVLPESLLYAYQISNNDTYKEIAEESFHFLLDNTFKGEQIKVVSNQGWRQKAASGKIYGEQPIDIAGTVIALSTFYSILGKNEYYQKQKIAFSWFLGNNHLEQIIYNPSTGGCYDGLEEYNVNLNQGAESTISYLMARLCMGS